MGERVAEHESDFKLHLETVVQHILSLNQQISSLQDSLNVSINCNHLLVALYLMFAQVMGIVNERLDKLKLSFGNRVTECNRLS